MPQNDWVKDFRNLQDFVVRWYGIERGEASDVPEVADRGGVPVVLKHFYDLCGSQLDIVVGYDQFAHYDELEIGRLPIVFCHEAQSVFLWALFHPPAGCRNRGW